MNDILHMSFLPVLKSIFQETREMRMAKEKSTLKNVLKKDISSKRLVKQLPIIIDGSDRLYTCIIHWTPSRTFSECVTGFRKYIVINCTIRLVII